MSDLDFSVCLIKIRDAGGSGGSTDHCTLGSNCLGFFGPDSDFPQRPADDPATAEDESDPRYVFKCDFDGSTGHLPARFADGRTMCECPAGGAEDEDGVCACPAGTVLLGEACLVDTPENKCRAAGWTVSVDNRCALPLSSPDGGSAEGCFLDGDGSPQCAEVFGLGLSFPNPPADSDARFVYNCGLDMIPARANTDGQTECAPDPQACKFSDIEAVFETLEKKNRVSLQFDACRAKGWGARHSFFGDSRL